MNQIVQIHARAAPPAAQPAAPATTETPAPEGGTATTALDGAAFDKLHAAIVRANGKIHELAVDVARLNSAAAEMLAHSLLFDSLPDHQH